jgi:hypothetical protein
MQPSFYRSLCLIEGAKSLKSRKALLNTNGKALHNALHRVGHLRQGYKDARRGDTAKSDEAIHQIRALLSDPSVSGTLDRLLREEPVIAEISQGIDKIPKHVLTLEEQLGDLFGFSPKQVRHHISKACKSGAKLGAPYSIRDSSELASTILTVHKQVKMMLIAEGWVHFLRRRRAMDEAESAAYSIGTLIADGLKPMAFSYSSSIASSTFSRLGARQ